MVRIVCRNEECPDSLGRTRVPPSLVVVPGGETTTAWILECRRCAKDGRISRRVVTKDIAGGTFGSGRKDDGSGQSGGEGVSRYVHGANLR